MYVILCGGVGGVGGGGCHPIRAIFGVVEGRSVADSGYPAQSEVRGADEMADRPGYGGGVCPLVERALWRQAG